MLDARYIDSGYTGEEDGGGYIEGAQLALRAGYVSMVCSVKPEKDWSTLQSATGAIRHPRFGRAGYV